MVLVSEGAQELGKLQTLSSSCYRKELPHPGDELAVLGNADADGNSKGQERSREQTGRSTIPSASSRLPQSLGRPLSADANTAVGKAVVWLAEWPSQVHKAQNRGMDLKPRDNSLVIGTHNSGVCQGPVTMSNPFPYP